MRGFILAAGEGTRLRPLTGKIPKPLIPVFHKPLLTFALDHFLALGIREIGINTRYLWERFYTEFSVTSETPSSHEEGTFYAQGSYYRQPLQLFRESLPIDTGGALRNARPFLEQGTFLLHNGDMFSNIPLTGLIEHHRGSGAIATLLLRDEGPLNNVEFDEEKNQIVSIRGVSSDLESYPLFFYPGIAVIEPALLDWIEPKGPASLIDALLAAMQAGQKVAGFVNNSGSVSDLGTMEAYLKIHKTIQESNWKFSFPLHTRPLAEFSAGNAVPGASGAQRRGVQEEFDGASTGATTQGTSAGELCKRSTEEALFWPTAIHPTATIDPSATLHGTVVIGPRAHVGAHAKLTNCILLPEVFVPAGQEVSETVLF